MYSDEDLLAEGLPHSDILGSKPARGSPRLFAACHVLRRLLVPRHPPNALLSFNFRSEDHFTLTTANSNEICGMPTMHRNHSSEFLYSSKSFSSSQPARNEPKKTKTPPKNPNNASSVPAEIPCSIHGHHNRNHCIITHLNTRIFNDYASSFYTIHRSDNPSPKTRASNAECFHIHRHQHARPNAPKPIHPDKEQFAPQQPSWEQTSDPSA